ncbi:3'-5' exoribonuclease [Clostridium sp.]|uniref:3'-5' exoribonuclease n=1 Tax=Clostridium sp. TaxID=1506 RepID=UPI0026170F86|nr:3'-5' exoribonuclease [Clostridium sp.]
MAKIFFDTEFTGLHKGTTLISIGLIAEDGTTFYGELTDYSKGQVDNWIHKNVIDKLIFKNEEPFVRIEPVLFNKSIEVKGTKKNVSEILLKWLNQFGTIEWISDVCHYDFVLLINIWSCS